MKAIKRRGRKRNIQVSREAEVRSEIQSFLQALASYPERFSREPRVSFEQHRESIGVSGGQHEPTSQRGENGGRQSSLDRWLD